MPNDAKLLRNAIALHQAGRMQEAEKAYRKVLRANAIHTDGLRLLGALYLQTGQAGPAAEVLVKAARLAPGDAETLTNLGVALRGLKQPDEAMAHFQQALVACSDYLPALQNLGSLFYEAGRGAEAGDVYGQIVQLNPDKASAHFNYGNSLLSSGKVAEAADCYEQALKLKPDYLEAMINLGIAFGLKGKSDQSKHWLRLAQEWLEKALATDTQNTTAMNNLGNILRQLGEAEKAVTYFRKALSLHPTYAEAATNLATSLRDLGRLDEAIESCRSVLRLSPNSADTRINLGVFLQEKGRHEEAAAVFTEALLLKPFSIDAQWNKALSLLALGQYKEGWALHEAGLGIAHMRGDYVSEKRWNGEDLAGKRLLIRCEQGLGDNLQFVRYAELCKARGATVFVLCPEALRPLLVHCPFIDALPENIGERDFDLHVPIMSLPYIFGTELNTIPANFPYLHIGEATRARWAEKFAGNRDFKIGLVWAGNPREDQINAHLIDCRRSMDLDMLRPLFDVEGTQFYNLQMGTKAGQIDSCGLRSHVIDFMGEVQNFEDTGAIVEHLDLVISVDTSVVHLAGAMGKPVWVLSRFDACWRWLQNQPANPWYPSARIFGQRESGDWTNVVMQVKEALVETEKVISFI